MTLLFPEGGFHTTNVLWLVEQHMLRDGFTVTEELARSLGQTIELVADGTLLDLPRAASEWLDQVREHADARPALQVGQRQRLVKLLCAFQDAGDAEAEAPFVAERLGFEETE